MSALIRNRALVEDEWITLADDAPLPPAGCVIIPLARWLQERDAPRAGSPTIGVRIPNTTDLAQAWPVLAGCPLIALEFPAFADGRAYSQARLLRDRYAFRGELRATGASVVRDQLQGMERCGIDSFALRADQDPAVCLGAFGDLSLAYQPAADAAITVLQRRRAG